MNKRQKEAERSRQGTASQAHPSESGRRPRFGKNSGKANKGPTPKKPDYRLECAREVADPMTGAFGPSRGKHDMRYDVARMDGIKQDIRDEHPVREPLAEQGAVPVVCVKCGERMEFSQYDVVLTGGMVTIRNHGAPPRQLRAAPPKRRGGNRGGRNRRGNRSREQAVPAAA